MAEAKQSEWYPAVGEPNVRGRFGYTEVLDIKASKDADEKKYKSILVLFTKAIGETDTPGPIKVLPENRFELAKRFPDAWRAYEGEKVEIGGTPLDALELPPEKLLELRIFGVVRMEDAAGLSDQQCETMGFGTKAMRARARVALGRDPGNNVGPAAPVAAPQPIPANEIAQAVAQALAQAKSTRDAEIAEAVAAALKAQKPEPEAPAKRRGRPPKAAASTAPDVAA